MAVCSMENKVGNEDSQLKILSRELPIPYADSCSRRNACARNSSGGISTTLPSRQI